MTTVEHEPFQKLVGDDFDIAIAEGQTRLLIVLQDSKAVSHPVA